MIIRTLITTSAISFITISTALASPSLGEGVREGGRETGNGIQRGGGEISEGIRKGGNEYREERRKRGAAGAVTGGIKATGETALGVGKGAVEVGAGAVKGAGCVITLGKAC